MFTGIVTDIGTVRSVEGGGDTRFTVATSFDTGAIGIGASIACSGPCLTVVATGGDWFAVEASQETLSRTTAGLWRAGTRLNLERALRVGDELGGHIVSGHVDDIAIVIGRRKEGDSVRFSLAVPEAFARFVAPKGSIALDGVSLTVNEVDGVTFGVNVISHTQQATTLGGWQPGTKVNFEVDMLARYVARLTEGN